MAAADGALVLMAHLRFPAHIGVWLKPEARVGEYLSNDLTEPAYGPIEFELREVQMTGMSLTGTVMVKNLQPSVSRA